ncbi:Marvel-containing potential lipid raft-associated protein [Paragonimus skrjabini miyazakii]|uniref:Marvel-containing potential lipid raft-associated protein n=1 Tax=Paragonimus skrjabini miyazakii TaxID=59628 RepID=A0A8S9YVH5_9TREM|nr:Marvel-containing potential lipid raft-associated protein [Paragonimus skrjabini miyazakii]
MGLNSSYASTIPAVFKIVEAVLNIITIILVSVTQNYRDGAAGWLLFVSILTFIVSVFFYIIHLTNVIYKLSGPMTFIEFMCITISGVFQLICIIVAAATANSRGTVIAAAVIFSLNFVIYGIDAFFLYALYKVHGGYLNNPAVAQQTDPNQTQLSTSNYPPEATYENAAYSQ